MELAKQHPYAYSCGRLQYTARIVSRSSRPITFNHVIESHLQGKSVLWNILPDRRSTVEIQDWARHISSSVAVSGQRVQTNHSFVKVNFTSAVVNFTSAVRRINMQQNHDSAQHIRSYSNLFFDGNVFSVGFIYFIVNRLQSKVLKEALPPKNQYKKRDLLKPRIASALFWLRHSYSAATIVRDLQI